MVQPPAATPSPESTLQISKHIQNLSNNIVSHNAYATIHQSDLEEKIISDMMNINAILDQTTIDLLELRQLLKTPENKLWMYGAFNELELLAQGSKNQTNKFTNTINFISPNQKPTKKRPLWVWITVGGDKIYFAGESFTPNSDITISKCLFNSVISTEYDKFLGLDINDFNRNTYMDDYEYMWLTRWNYPQYLLMKTRLNTSLLTT